MIADHDLAKKSFGSMIADHDLAKKRNNHGCWGKHAHIPDNDYWGICLFHVVWTTKINCITLKIRSKADVKSKSQTIWQHIILFSSTVKQMICAWHKIWTLSGRLSLMRNVQLACLSSSSLLWRLISFRLFCSDDCRSWPREEKFWFDDCRFKLH
jgi:hypothetical protein